MNLERLQSIYYNTSLADKTDIEDVRQLTEDYPYYSLPYVVLSKYYYETKHYRFEEMLKQAAMRVKDRKALYDYIHSIQQNIPAQDIEDKQSPEEIVQEQDPEPTVSVLDFLGPEIIEQAPDTQPAFEATIEAPVIESTDNHIDKLVTPVEQAPLIEEFVIDTTAAPRSIDKIEIDYDIIGEEIETEFSFSKSFGTSEEVTDNSFVVDNTGFSEPNTPTNNQDEPEGHLRKYPVYSIDNYFKDQAPVITKEEEAPSSEKDFFAWLKAPKTQDNTLNQEQVKEPKEDFEIEPKEVMLAEENVTNKSDSLDLIDRFISINPQISRPKKEFFNPENMAKRSEVIDLELVSETLANIYYEQGNYELATKAYEKLSLQNPSKASYFADLIEKIKKERK